MASRSPQTAARAAAMCCCRCACARPWRGGEPFDGCA